jgi:ribA/ribD-fused uncharacterized protein
MSRVDYSTTRYKKGQCVSFRKTKDRYGGLSNMCSGFPILVGNYSFLTSEHLYQVCRFNEYSDIQEVIQNEKSPMGGKMKSKRYISYTRDDWDFVRVDIMDWCIRMKLKCNWYSFGGLLLSTGENEIVEDSHKDRFWGCVLDSEGDYVGRNILGKLLMNLREELTENTIDRDNLNVNRIKGIKLFGELVHF